MIVDHGSIHPKVENWTKNKTKKLRMEGNAYFEYSRAKDGKVTHKSARNAREIGLRCYSKECLRIKSRHCFGFTEQSRQILFQYFWSKMNWGQRSLRDKSCQKVKTTRIYTKKNETRRK